MLDGEFRSQRKGYGEGMAARTVADGIGWQRQQSVGRGDAGRHVGIGSFRREELEADVAGLTDRMACAVPFLVADIDGESWEDSYGATVRVVEALAARGLDPATVLVSFTGGRGFHVRVPHGAVGRPVYRDARTAKAVVSEFFYEVLGRLHAWDLVDRNLFSPRATVRAIGSVHERTGWRCIGLTGAPLLETGLEPLLCDSEMRGLDVARSVRPRSPTALHELLDGGLVCPFGEHTLRPARGSVGPRKAEAIGSGLSVRRTSSAT